MQRISTERLKRRAKDVYYWTKELERVVIEMREKTRLLEETRVRTENWTLTDPGFRRAESSLLRTFTRSGSGSSR